MKNMEKGGRATVKTKKYQNNKNHSILSSPPFLKPKGGEGGKKGGKKQDKNIKYTNYTNMNKIYT